MNTEFTWLLEQYIETWNDDSAYTFYCNHTPICLEREGA